MPAAAWVLYEVNLATSWLVTVVVTFVLVPAAIKNGSHIGALPWALVRSVYMMIKTKCIV